MKQKAAPVKAKLQLNGGVKKSKQSPKDLRNKMVAEEIVAKTATKTVKPATKTVKPATKTVKAAIKKQANLPSKKKVVPVVQEESEDEDLEDLSIEHEQESENDSNDENANEQDSDDENANEEGSDDENEGDSDEENANENSDDENAAEADSDDEEPSEVPIVKTDASTDANKLPASDVTPRINPGYVPKGFPHANLIVVKNVPKNTKQIEFVNIFAKYGSIHTINIFHFDEETSNATIAFNTPKAAEDALAANNTAKIRENTLEVVSKSIADAKSKLTYAERKEEQEKCKDRTVYVRNLKKGTTEKEVKAHFESCGTIESVYLVRKTGLCYGFIKFAEEDGATEATKLNNSVLNKTIISVSNDKEKNKKKKDSKYTILLKNPQYLENVTEDKLREIFSKCGEIDQIEIRCLKYLLAYITFKDENSVQEALKLNGTVAEDNFKISVLQYRHPSDKDIKDKLAVFVSNIKPGVTEEEIRAHFEPSGSVENVLITGKTAKVRFSDADGFCKAFLLNESVIHGQMIFLKPYSLKKPRGVKRPPPFHKTPMKKFKRN